MIIDAATALAGLEAAVAERGPDFVYPDEWRHVDRSCLYSRTDDAGNVVPACMVGHALYLITGDLVGDVIAGPGIAAEAIGHELTDYAGRILADVQNVQDYGHTWARALDAARARAVALDVN